MTTAASTLLVDARVLHASGLGRYLRELLAEWLRDPPFRSIELLGDPDALGAFLDAHPTGASVRVVPHAGRVYSARSQWSWLAARLARGARERVTFFPHWDVPLALFPRRSVVTVHDITPFRVPDAFTPGKRALGRPMLRHAVRRATRVVCVGQATASDLGEWFPSVARKLVAVPNGVSQRFFGRPPGPPPLDESYVLCVGNQKPHKNLGAAVDVLAALRPQFPSLRLVVAGGRDTPTPIARARAAELGLGDAVVELGAVDDDLLHRCYAGAAALLFPSRYEGFGLPVVEAMAAGAPVVASSTPAVREVVGGAAPVYDPDDVRGMAAEVRTLLTDPTLRATRIADGRERASQFSWARAARETARVLHDAAGEARAPARRPLTAERA
ncbi:glycosyl transferase group 1 [Gemmatirosa kalamazoonensis]|uniref:Glycosyl transferase group 1 n=1 Tax=Gemmatirosa kalamazoonensis TaxID=861299 RepID=W0RKQ5_9BACT|nr:glycosyltransferase family 1 protein [Gemmatirosa kalamazoonensis]AHG91022.1 glycosyl transferase group 1 [Gemmatirosa kalamazoonensis]